MGPTSSSSSTNPSTVMSILIWFAVILVACSAVPTEIVPGVLRVDPLANAPGSYPEKDCDGTVQTACASCDTVKLCITKEPPLDALNLRQKCPAALPYCSMSASPVRAVCQKTPDTSVTSCATAVPTFTCTGTGYFADINSCQTYYYCTKQGATAEVYDCPDGYKFSAKTNACAQSTTPCPTFNCSLDHSNSLFLPLPSNTQYYVFCYLNINTNNELYVANYMFSCGQGATFDPTTGMCVFTCPKEGLYVNSAYPRRYYQCYLNSGKLVYKEQVCSVSQIFDATAKKCVADPNYVPPTSG